MTYEPCEEATSDERFRYRFGSFALSVMIARVGTVGLTIWAIAAGKFDLESQILVSVLILSTFVAMRFDIVSQRRAYEQRSSITRHLSRHIVELKAMADRTTVLADGVTTYLSARLKALEELESKVKTQEALAELTKDQSDAIDNILDNKFRRSSRISLWQQLAFMFGGVILGFFASYVLQIVTH